MIQSQGSNRVYTREKDEQGQSIIRVQGTNRDENRAFIYLARHFAAKGLPVPQILWVSDDEMSYTQTDLGDTVLFDIIQHGRDTGCFLPEERRLLDHTVRALAHIQIEGAEGLDWSYCYPIPAMDERSIRWDLNYFKYCFLKCTHIEFSEPKLEDDFDRLVETIMSAFRHSPCAFLYRDMQSRNVMLMNDEPYFIDFQGGRRGPTQYDVASFLWQAKANLPQALRNELLEAYLEEMRQLQPGLDEQEWRAMLPHFVLFRMLQVFGAYGYRGYFERKAHFLGSIPNAIRNLKELFDKHPELRTRYPYLCHVSDDLLILL